MRREPVDVAEQEARPLVGREPPGEADRQDVRVERRLERVEHRRRLAVPGELVAEAAPGEDRQLQLLALVRLPQLVGRDLVEALPEAAAAALARRGCRGPPGRPSPSVSPIAWPTQLGVWMPFVTPPIPCGAIDRHVASAVSAWSWLTAFAVARQPEREARSCRTGPRRRRRPSPARAPRSSGTPPVCGRPSPSSSGPATRRTRSVAKRSLPAETGVWIVKTLSARTRSQGVVERRAGRRRTRGPAPRAGTPSGPR